MLDVVVLAGSVNSGPLRECSEEANEAMIKIGSKPMIRYVVDALIKAQYIRKIVIVGPNELKKLFSEEFVEVIEATGTAVENLIRGLGFVDTSGKVMIATCDIPLLTAKAVDDFIQTRCEPEVDLYYPIVPMELIHSRFPSIKRTCVKLCEGNFTGGNLFIINPSVVADCEGKVQQFIDYRKSPIHLSRILGVKFVIKFLLNRLSIPELEKKVSQVLGIRGKAVVTMYPEIGVDVDKASDYSIVSAYLK